MGIDVSFVVVAHRSSGVLPAAVASFRREAASIGVNAEVVVVEQSEDDGEVERARSVRPDTLLVRPNRGFAAGINAGFGASAGTVVVLANPDVIFEAGSLGELLDALKAGWGVVGPQFAQAGLLLPPADVQAPGEELRRWLASQHLAFWRSFFRSQVKRWRHVWSAGGTVATPHLPGAMLAAPAALVRRLGPWDERYFLFFEETDWLRRAIGQGVRIGTVPTARAQHHWGHATGPAETREHYSASRTLFYRKNFGLAGKLVAPLEIRRSPLRPSDELPRRLKSAEGGVLWLLSPTSIGFPAAGLEAGPEVPFADLDAMLGVSPPDTKAILIAMDQNGRRLLGLWRMARRGLQGQHF